MTELSPAASAVLQAITEISPAPADEIAATALRAAASYAKAIDRLRAIANELEATS